MDHLSKSEESLLENLGTAGLVFSGACLFQILFYMIPHWINYTIIVCYVLSLVGYILLIKKKPVSFLLLLVSTVLVFLLEMLAIRYQVYSMLLLILSLYSVVTLVFLYMSDILKKLKRKEEEVRLERKKWENIL